MLARHGTGLMTLAVSHGFPRNLGGMQGQVLGRTLRSGWNCMIITITISVDRFAGVSPGFY